MNKLAVQLLFLASLVLIALSLWQRRDLPQYRELQPALLQEPEQVQVKRAPFETTVNGVTYTIKPLHSYDLNGLVVSLHDADTWWDYLHKQWNDHLNVMDLCVVWGNNLQRGVYKEVTYSSGQFECFVKIPNWEIHRVFDPTALSNNHLLTDKPQIARAIRKVRHGDQVRFRGYLAEYSHNHQGRPFNRGTSTVRNDTGNGACETIFIEEFEILKRGGGPWHAILWLAIAMLTVSIVCWFRLPLAENR